MPFSVDKDEQISGPELRGVIIGSESANFCIFKAKLGQNCQKGKHHQKGSALCSLCVLEKLSAISEWLSLTRPLGQIAFQKVI